ncbi:MAG TPA: TIGR04282 family arsenosugar biosynthesis glycosyltransferase, partial [Nitrospirota bacterium]|nr:TIGR04282 family arsenosugar biosynthesis glycosyltransferase [Nitrospirota bacterium]
MKSRLSRSMGEDAVLHLYECFVLDVMEMLKAGGIPFRICFTPAEKREAITGWLGKGETYQPQEGVDLGERMANAFRRAFSEGITEALIIGSDLPDLPHALLEEAFRSLHAHDAVIGPAIDGGYY